MWEDWQMGKRIYVETTIHAPMELLWQRTQNPAQHSRWDLRFGEIRALPAQDEDVQRFRYATRLLPGLTVAGTGVHAGERHRPDGSCTSALRFRCAHPLSIIKEGSGYWCYRPRVLGSPGREVGESPPVIVFLTGYDYQPGWGRLGPLADRLLFRPLIGWATAWSFDRLRLWCERDVTPERSRNQALAELTARAMVASAAIGTLARARTTAPAGRARIAIATALLGAAIALPPRATTPAARRTRRHPAPAERKRRTGHPLPTARTHTSMEAAS